MLQAQQCITSYNLTWQNSVNMLPSYPLQKCEHISIEQKWCGWKQIIDECDKSLWWWTSLPKGNHIMWRNTITCIEVMCCYHLPGTILFANGPFNITWKKKLLVGKWKNSSRLEYINYNSKISHLRWCEGLSMQNSLLYRFQNLTIIIMQT